MEPTISITYGPFTPSILAELANLYVLRMCTLAGVATAKEPFHLLGEAPCPLPSSTGTGAGCSLRRVSFANHLAGGRIRQGVAAPCQALLFLSQFQRLDHIR
jgi:hypothetical protein